MPFDDITDFRDMLNEAYAANHYWEATSEAAEQLAQELFRLTERQELEGGRIKRPRNTPSALTFRRAIASWTANLLVNATHEASRGYLYCSSAPEFLNGHMTIRGIKSIAATWDALGLHERIKCSRHIDEDGHAIYRKASRYRATGGLLRIAASFGIDSENLNSHFTVDTEQSSAISLRAKKSTDSTGRKEQGRHMPIPNTAEAIMAEERVADINRLLAGFTFDGIPRPILKRVFNRGDDPEFNWNMGGRLYAQGPGNYQNIATKERRLIRIDGEPVVELDIKASHLTIVYGLMGQTLDQARDPYEVGDIPRELVKQALVPLLSTGRGLKQWPKGFKQEYTEGTGKPFPRLTAKDVTVRIPERHPVLLRTDPSEINWYRLQFNESEALLSAMETLTHRAEIPSLPLHDSLIVKQSDQDAAREALLNGFKAACGITPTIEQKL